MAKRMIQKSVNILLAALFIFTMIPLSGIFSLKVQVAASIEKFDVKVRWRAAWTKSFTVKSPTDNKTYSISGSGTIIYLDGITAYCLQLGAPATSNPSATLRKAGISDESYFKKRSLSKDMQQQIALMLSISQAMGTSGHRKGMLVV